ncbi:MAG: hypothetical protein NT086_11165 [Proteobacteria bacterium]|nr:hypothetical protein [Pseudomonadota bacterium]
MDIPSIRRANLTLLAQPYASRNAFCEAAQLRPDQLNHLLAGSKNIGNRLATRIENQLNLTSGSLSHPTNAQFGQSLLDNDPRRELLRALSSATLTHEDALALLHIVKIISDSRLT